MAKLPQDLITDILSRLPVKSLLRFRCVSKPFCSLIDSQEFKRLHLNRSVGTNSNLGIILEADFFSKFFYTSLDSLDAVEMDHPFNENYGAIIGCCNGLVALGNSTRGRVLCNPSTKKHRILPKILIDSRNYDLHGSISVDGFGYDAFTDDYKWVRIVQFQEKRKYLESFVYSLKSNSWRKTKDFPFCYDNIGGYGALAGGTLNWVAIKESKPYGERFIIGFDLKNEEISVVSQPEIEGICPHISLAGLGECLSVSCCCEHGYEMWVMKEHGVKDSWTKLFSWSRDVCEGQFVSCSVGILSEMFIRRFASYTVRPFAYSKSGDKVLLYEASRELCWYNLKDLGFESIEIHGRPQRSREVCLYVESLVALDAGKVMGA